MSEYYAYGYQDKDDYVLLGYVFGSRAKRRKENEILAANRLESRWDNERKWFITHIDSNEPFDPQKYYLLVPADSIYGPFDNSVEANHFGRDHDFCGTVRDGVYVNYLKPQMPFLNLSTMHVVKKVATELLGKFNDQASEEEKKLVCTDDIKAFAEGDFYSRDE